MPKLSFTTMGTPDMSGPEAIRAARKYGYQGVDLRVSDHKGELTVASTVDEIAALRRVFDAEGILPAGLLCYVDVGSPESGSWEKMETSILRHLEIGVSLGSPTVRIFRGNPAEYASPGAYVARSAEVIRRVLEKDASPVRLLLQHHGGSYTFLQAVVLAKKVDHPRFGLVFSPDHSVMMGEDMDAVFAAAPEFSVQIYVADVAPSTAPDAPRKFHGILPGRGVVPLREAYEALGGDAFEGWVSFKWEKIWQPDLSEPDVALPHFITWFRAGMA